MDNLKGKKVHEIWKNDLITWEEYRNIDRACRDATRKYKALLVLKLAKEVNDNKKGFFFLNMPTLKGRLGKMKVPHGNRMLKKWRS